MAFDGDMTFSWWGGLPEESLTVSVVSIVTVSTTVASIVTVFTVSMMAGCVVMGKTPGGGCTSSNMGSI